MNAVEAGAETASLFGFRGVVARREAEDVGVNLAKQPQVFAPGKQNDDSQGNIFQAGPGFRPSIRDLTTV